MHTWDTKAFGIKAFVRPLAYWSRLQSWTDLTFSSVWVWLSSTKFELRRLSSSVDSLWLTYYRAFCMSFELFSCTCAHHLFSSTPFVLGLPFHPFNTPVLYFTVSVPVVNTSIAPLSCTCYFIYPLLCITYFANHATLYVHAGDLDHVLCITTNSSLGDYTSLLYYST